MFTRTIKAGLFSLGVSAMVLGGIALAPVAALAQQVPPQQQAPDECSGMTFDRVVVMTTPIYTSHFADRELVFAPKGMTATITLLLAHDSCIVAADSRINATVFYGNNVLIGSPQRDALNGGRGNDLIIGNGAPSGERDVEAGGSGTDTCVGLPGSTVKVTCEILLDEEQPVQPCSCAQFAPDAALFGDDSVLATATHAIGLLVS
jgi:hypothetical protein